MRIYTFYGSFYIDIGSYSLIIEHPREWQLSFGIYRSKKGNWLRWLIWFPFGCFQRHGTLFDKRG